MTRRIDPALIPEKPDLSFETALWNAGLSAVAGVDEAGRGCLAGPVFAAAVIIPDQAGSTITFSDIHDSKQLSEKARESLRKLIEQNSLSWGVGQASNTEIDQYGILPATRLAVSRAIAELSFDPAHLLVDYITLPDNPLPQTRLVKGDARSVSIAAASILAKTHRDSFMIQASETYSEYGFDQNKGYGTTFHRNVIQEFGPCPLHRLSFAPFRVEIEAMENRQLYLDL